MLRVAQWGVKRFFPATARRIKVYASLLPTKNTKIFIDFPRHADYFLISQPKKIRVKYDVIADKTHYSKLERKSSYDL